MLTVSNLQVSIDDKPILKGLNLDVQPGTIHALMGQNGSGKSTLASTLVGHPYYCITQGTISFKGHVLNDLSPDKRAKLGIFLAFQNPVEIPGVTLGTFLKEALQAITGEQLSLALFNEKLYPAMQELGLDSSYAHRSLNSSFSGGEKKRLELLQLYLLKPDLVILDEIDSGLDIDALKLVAKGIMSVYEHNPSMSIVLITHYQRILDYVVPDQVHIMRAGLIVHSGSADVVRQIEAQGYDGIR